MFVLENKKPNQGWRDKISKLKFLIKNILKQNSLSDYVLVLKIISSGIYCLLGNNKKNIVSIIKFPPQNLIDEEKLIKDKDGFYFLISEWLKKQGVTTPQLIGIIPEEKTFYKIVSLQKNFKEEEKNKIINSILPINYENAIIDWQEFQPLFSFGNHIDFPLWATEFNYLKNFYDLMSNFKIIGLEPENKSLIKMVFKNFYTPDAVLNIFSFNQRIILIVFAGRAIHFSGVFNLNDLGYQNFIEEILKIINFYKNKVYHEHDASYFINKIYLFGQLPKEIISLIALNTKMKIEQPQILLDDKDIKFNKKEVKKLILDEPEFLSLVGALKNKI